MTTEERITKELLHEQAAIWYISDLYGAKVMVKIPSASIKSVMKGCKVEFLFGRDNVQNPAMFHSGIKVHDDPVHYLSITGIERFLDEHASLENIMGRSFTYIHFHDELSVCVATAKLAFSPGDQFKVTNLQGNIKLLYCGDFDNNAERSLDCFDHSLKMERNFENVYEIETLAIEGTFSDWIVMRNDFIGDNYSNKIEVSNADEGGNFEQQIAVVLDSLFYKQIFKNPLIKKGNGFRELTDVFAHYDHGLFLIETKALAIINTDAGRDMKRKVTGLQKQIGKGIDQLVGAWKKIELNVSVYDTNKNEIVFNRNMMPHCIVLVSELLPFGDWKTTELKMFVAMTENKLYLNVMDLREFMQYVGYAQGSKDRLNLMLIERVENLIKHESIHMKLHVIKDDTN